MLSLIALKSLTPLSKRLLLLLSAASLNITTNWPKLLLMLELLVFSFFAFKSQNLLLSVLLLLLSQKSPSTPKSLPRLSLTKVPFLTLLL